MIHQVEFIAVDHFGNEEPLARWWENSEAPTRFSYLHLGKRKMGKRVVGPAGDENWKNCKAALLEEFNIDHRVASIVRPPMEGPTELKITRAGDPGWWICQGLWCPPRPADLAPGTFVELPCRRCRGRGYLRVLFWKRRCPRCGGDKVLLHGPAPSPL